MLEREDQVTLLKQLYHVARRRIPIFCGAHEDVSKLRANLRNEILTGVGPFKIVPAIFSRAQPSGTCSPILKVLLNNSSG